MNAPQLEVSLDHVEHVEGFARTLFWVFVAAALAFIAGGLVWVL